MKKTCFVLLCALFLSLAPSTFAADNAALGPFDALLSQLVALFSGSAAPAEMGWQIMPGGQAAVEEPESGTLPPNSNSLTEPELEMGAAFMPGG